MTGSIEILLILTKIYLIFWLIEELKGYFWIIKTKIMGKIKIEVTAFGIKHSAIINSDATAEEFIEKCYLLAEAISYDPRLIREALAVVKKRFE